MSREGGELYAEQFLREGVACDFMLTLHELVALNVCERGLYRLRDHHTLGVGRVQTVYEDVVRRVRQFRRFGGGVLELGDTDAIAPLEHDQSLCVELCGVEFRGCVTGDEEVVDDCEYFVKL